MIVQLSSLFSFFFKFYLHFKCYLLSQEWGRLYELICAIWATLIIGDKSYLIILHDSLNVFLNLVHCHLEECFYNHIHQRKWPINFLLALWTCMAFMIATEFGSLPSFSQFLGNTWMGLVLTLEMFGIIHHWNHLVWGSFHWKIIIVSIIVMCF